MCASRRLLPSLLFLALASFESVCAAQTQPTSPANETRVPDTIRSPHSAGADFNVPLCPAQFHDALATNGIAGPQEKNLTQPKLKSTVPALVTQQAIDASGKAHIGNYLVIVDVVVDTKGDPQHLCLRKSSGFGLDASAATAVQQYRFIPARENGKPAPMRVPVEVRFASPL